MRAVLCSAFGRPEDLAIAELPEPRAGAGEVRLTVTAAGVNFADLLMVAGQYQEKPPLPFTPGLEVAGIVIDCGAGADAVAPGQRVLATLERGGYAEQATARVGEVAAIPDDMDFATAAGFAIAYGTAYGALRWRADLRPGETLLVHGAGGGVGLAAVEVGRALGATVIATAGGAERLDAAARHGAQHVIDHRTEDIRARVKEIAGGADVVFDPVGGAAFEASLRAVNWGARLVIIGFASGKVPQIPANVLLVKNISAIGFYWGSYRRRRPDLVAGAFAELFAWYRAGLLRPLVSERLPLAQAGAALRRLADRRATGKLVLIPEMG